MLRRLGYDLAGEDETSLFGQQTCEAIIDFQYRQGLEASDVVDESTMAAIEGTVAAHYA